MPYHNQFWMERYEKFQTAEISINKSNGAKYFMLAVRDGNINFTDSGNESISLLLLQKYIFTPIYN
jgi:hypothetical protein